MIGPPEQEDTVVIDHLTVRYRHVTACHAVSLRIRPGSIYALLGRSGAGKSSVVRCVLGQLKPAAGRVLVLGQDAWRHRRKVRRSVQAISAETDTARIALALAAEPRLLVLDDPAFGPGIECRAAVQEELAAAASRRGMAILFATGTPSDVERIADRVGLLNRGNLLLDEDIAILRSRFRRIRYRSEVTLTRTEYGNELDLFDAVRVRVRGWGIEAIVSNYSQDAFERFRLTDGVVGAEETLMSLSEIFEAVSPDRPAIESSKP
jgi:ABC-2 type transport system ATP-binding protein